MKHLSPPRRAPRLLVLALVMTLSSANYAAVPESCGVAGPGVFNVFDNGKIAITNQAGYVRESDTCKVTFSGSNYLNVTTEGYYTPSQNGDGVTGACSTKPTNTTLNKLTLPNFPTERRNVDVKIYNNGNYIDVTEPSLFGTEKKTYQKFTNSPFRWCKNPSDDNNKCFNAQNGMKNYTQADGVTFATEANSNFIFSNNTENVYNEISIDNSQVYFKYDGNRPYIINHLVSTNNAILTFEPGDYFIRELDFPNVNIINVAGAGDGSGKARIYILNGNDSQFIGNQSCFNMTGITSAATCTPKPTPSVDYLSAQHPEKLGFYFYNGSVTFGDTAYVSASIYVHNGDLTFTGNGNTAFAGEALAANIHLGNMPNFMHYKDTGAFTKLHQEASGTIPSHEGYYQLAPTAHPKRATTGELAFIPYQQDYLLKDGITQKRGGHVQAFAYKANGSTESTPTWDSSVKMDLIAQAMSGMGRMTYLYSNKADGTPVLMSVLGSIGTAFDGSAFGCDMGDVSCKCTAMAATMRSIAGPTLGTTSAMRSMDTMCAMMSGDLNLKFPSLASEWETIHGLPNGSKPLIYKDKVLFTTSDGYLYAVDRQTGVMDWGWIPRPLLAGLMDYKNFLLSDPMQGQIIGIANNGLLEDPNSADKSGIILGTAKGGALHYALKLDNNGDLDKVLWMDARKASDVGDMGTATLYSDLSGTSPNAAEQVIFADRTLYIVNNRIVTRRYADGDDAHTVTPPPGVTLTSTPLVALQDRKTVKNVLYVGASNGNIYTANLDNSPITLKSLDVATGVSFGEESPIKYLTYTRMGDYEYLTAQSDTRLTVFKRQISDAAPPATNQWMLAWTTDDSGSRDASADHVQTIPTNAIFSARVSVAGGVVSAPVSVYNKTTCLTDGYSYFFNLEDGKFPMSKVKYLGTTLITQNKLLGSGMATESTIQAFKGMLSFQSQSEQNVGTTSGTGTAKANGADDRFEIVGGSVIERRGWREIHH